MNIGGEFLVNFRESGSGYNVVIGNAVNFALVIFLPSGLIRVYPSIAPIFSRECYNTI